MISFGPLRRGVRKAANFFQDLFGKRKALGDFFRNGAKPKASELKKWAEDQGWTARQTPGGPLHYYDENGMKRMTMKKGSARTPGSETPHVELFDAQQKRIDPNGNPVTKKSVGNHTPIEHDID